MSKLLRPVGITLFLASFAMNVLFLALQLGRGETWNGNQWVSTHYQVPAVPLIICSIIVIIAAIVFMYTDGPTIEPGNHPDRWEILGYVFATVAIIGFMTLVGAVIFWIFFRHNMTSNGYYLYPTWYWSTSWLLVIGWGLEFGVTGAYYCFGKSDSPIPDDPEPDYSDYSTELLITRTRAMQEELQRRSIVLHSVLSS